MATAKVLTVKDKFNMAIRSIPAYERIVDKYVIIDNGTLYFIGDKSWLKVENLIPCNGTIRLPMKDLATIIDMPGSNPSITITGDIMVGTGGRTSVRMKAITDVTVPTLEIPEAERFTEMSDVFGFARDYYQLIGPNTTISTINLEVNGETKGLAILHDAKFVAAAIGAPVIEGDITKIGGAIENAAKNKAKACIAGNMLYTKITPAHVEGAPETVITTAMKLSAVSLSEHTRSMITGVLTGQVLNLPEITINVKTEDLVGLANSVGPDAEAKRPTWRTSENSISLEINETIGRVWNDSIPATCSGELEFCSRLITKDIVCAATASTAEKDEVHIKVDPFKKMMGIFAKGDNPKSFMIIGVMFRR